MARMSKTKRIKSEKYQSEDQVEIKNLIIIICVIIVCIVAVYFFTRLFVSKDLGKTEERTFTTGAINYDITLIGSMLNKPEEEYYVMIYDTDASDYVYYAGIVNNYINLDKEKILKIYSADLANELNKKYYGNEDNLDIENVVDFKISKPTLIKIKKGKIVNSYTTQEDIASELSIDEDKK